MDLSIYFFLLFLAFSQCSFGALESLEDVNEGSWKKLKDILLSRDMNHFTKEDRGLACDACIPLVDRLVAAVSSPAPPEEIAQNITQLCLELELFNDENICAGFVNNYAPEFFYMAEQDRLSSGNFCAILLGKGCGNWEALNSWAINIPGNKPGVVDPELPVDGTPTIKFLQLSDIHIDMTYTVNSTAYDCGELNICCGNITEMHPANPDQATKYWGGYKCDLPTWTLRNMLQQIRDTHTDIDYVIVTGDYPAHDIWLQSRQWNLDSASTGYGIIKEVFGNNIPIYSSLGNHESFPCNSYPTDRNVPASLDSSWLYPVLATLYGDNLDFNAINTMQQNGFYSVAVNSIPGLRIIAINSNFCYSLNFWVNYNWIDPFEQLEWLIQELIAAENNGEKVHILSHIPAGHQDCLGSWGREYARIIERFENTVVNQFYGHTHYDEYFVQYDEATNSRAVGHGFIAPSVTTHTDLNPAYRIYTMEGSYPGSSFRVLNHETYVFNLTEANTNGPEVNPVYYKLYDALNDLEMPSLFPRDHDALARRLAVDDDHWDKFLLYYSQDVYEFHTRRSVICALVTSYNLDDRKCQEIMGPRKSK